MIPPPPCFLDRELTRRYREMFTLAVALYAIGIEIVLRWDLN